MCIRDSFLLVQMTRILHGRQSRGGPWPTPAPPWIRHLLCRTILLPIILVFFIANGYGSNHENNSSVCLLVEMWLTDAAVLWTAKVASNVTLPCNSTFLNQVWSVASFIILALQRIALLIMWVFCFSGVLFRSGTGLVSLHILGHILVSRNFLRFFPSFAD